jgi:hypothetical protein
LSFSIQNTIARRTTRDAHEEYKIKRKKVRALFSSNEFVLLVISLIFIIITVVIYYIFDNYGASVQQLNTFAYQTLFMFMINCSIALVAAFAFLLIARLMTFLWSLLSKWLWNDKLNIFTLSIKHISDNKNIYQITILASLVFGTIIIPGISMETSIPYHIDNEAKYAMGGADLIIDYWLDPGDNYDFIFDEIEEIANKTEIRIYKMYNNNFDAYFTKPYEISAMAIEDFESFLTVVDHDLFENSIEDIQALETEFNILIHKDYAKENNIKPGQNLTTQKFSRYSPITYTAINTFKYFPATQLIKEAPFQNKELFAFIASRETIAELTRTFDFSTDVLSRANVLIKAVNESSIPIIKQKISEYGFLAKTYEDVYNELAVVADEFLKNNLYFFAYLSMFTLVFIGYFSGNKVFDDRVRMIESMYRVGAIRRQILLMFTFELVLVNFIPIIVMIFASLPLARFLSVFYLGVSEKFVYYKAHLSGWIITLLILGGLALSALGWLIALIPRVYRYKPVKQE